MTVKGIDVSAYQASDYQTTGFDFAFVKATEGTSYVNPKMVAQAARGRVAGMVVGFYHFLHPGSVDAQAKYFVAKASSQAGDILVCDWESTSSGHATNAEKDQFLRAVKALRPDHKVLLYCNTYDWSHRDTSSYCADGLWIADPNNVAGKPGIRASWLFHQYSSSGGIDRNLGNFTDKAALAAWAAGTTPQEDDMTPDQAAQLQALHDNLLSISSLTEKDAKGNAVVHGAGYYLAHIHYDALKIVAAETAQTAAITAMATALGKVDAAIDVAALVAEVKAAIDAAVGQVVIHLSSS